ncbi:hypothetical protein EW146_g5747 [Bondarzewia mesenterica]|uniref:Uncharacterized protein n=1 Tax=Bondarzewia mesenterica TaxID=1095465 RepID=A0A4S4LQJ9_9AGAM|nr:hypothetical protein EW146_g5747 [Bondarzewia mesenterica]
MVYPTREGKFDKADHSILIHGAHMDNTHLYKTAKGFWHPWWLEAHNTPFKDHKEFASNIKADLFNFVTALDCITGGFTLILHHSGIIDHILKVIPQNIQVESYFPPQLIAHYPELKQPVADITQKFIKDIAPISESESEWVARTSVTKPLNLPPSTRHKVDIKTQCEIELMQITIQENKETICEKDQIISALTEQLVDVADDRQMLLAHLEVAKIELAMVKEELSYARVNFEGLSAQHDILDREKKKLL